MIEVNNMDIFWSGLAQRASEHTWNERRSQLSKVQEIAIKDMHKKKEGIYQFELFFLVRNEKD